jgi:uncharacterized protein (TIGR02594 family)
MLIKINSTPRWGDHSEDVRILQSRLKAEGFDPGQLDGQWGSRTEIALRDFQSHNGYTVNGKLDDEQLRHLGIQVKIMNDSPWMTWMSVHEGEAEIKGPQDNPFIMNLYKYGNYDATHDEVAWCACLANAALKLTGFKGTDRADAKSFMNYGEVCELRYGAVIVLRHADGNHHVSFYSKSFDQNSVELFGGNQSDALIKKTYNVSGNSNGHDEIVAIRWPVR